MRAQAAIVGCWRHREPVTFKLSRQIVLRVVMVTVADAASNLLEDYESALTVEPSWGWDNEAV